MPVVYMTGLEGAFTQVSRVGGQAAFGQIAKMMLFLHFPGGKQRGLHNAVVLHGGTGTVLHKDARTVDAEERIAVMLILRAVIHGKALIVLHLAVAHRAIRALPQFNGRVARLRRKHPYTVHDDAAAVKTEQPGPALTASGDGARVRVKSLMRTSEACSIFEDGFVGIGLNKGPKAVEPAARRGDAQPFLEEMLARGHLNHFPGIGIDLLLERRRRDRCLGQNRDRKTESLPRTDRPCAS